MPEVVPALGPGSVLLASLQTAPACAAGRPAKLHQAHGLEQSGHCSVGIDTQQRSWDCLFAAGRSLPYWQQVTEDVSLTCT